MFAIKSPFLLISLLVSASSFAGITSVDVFHTDRSIKKQLLGTAEVNYYYLPAMEELDASLSMKLPKNEKDAVVYMSSFFNSEEGKKWVASAKRHSEGLTKLYGYQIDKTPAIVINGEAVVYGTTDIQEAVDAYID